MKWLSSKVNDRFSAYAIVYIIIAYLAIVFIYRGENIFSVPLNWLTLSVLVPIFLTDGIKSVIEALSKKSYLTGREDLSKVSVVIPTKDGGETVRLTIESLLKRFPRHNIIVASNGSKDDTCKIARSLGVKVLDIPDPIGKVNAINQGLHIVKTPYVLIMDDDTLIQDAKIPTELLDKGYEGVAFKVLPIKENWLTTIQLHEYRKSMDIGRAFHNSGATVQTVSGAVGLFHTNELIRQIELHSGEFSGEDLQRTLLIHAEKGKKGVVITDSVVETFAPKTLLELFNQRLFGWNPGFYSNIMLYIRILFSPHIKAKLRFEAMYSVLFVTSLDALRIVSLPVLLFSPVFIVIFYIVYVVFETITWLSMGRVEPYWVVLVMPFYGLFNFVSRVGALGAFLYRRLTYYFMSHKNEYDDYRRAGIKSRILAVLTSIFILFIPISSYTTATIIPGSQLNQLLELTIPHQEPLYATLIESGSITPAFSAHLVQANLQDQIELNAAISPKIEYYEYTAKAGDSYWRLYKNAINSYAQEHQLIISGEKRKNMVDMLLTSKSHPTLLPGVTVTIRISEIENAYYY